MEMSETCPMVNMGRNDDQDLTLALVSPANVGRNFKSTQTAYLTLDEQGAERLRNACQTYLDARRVEVKNAQFKAAYSRPQRAMFRPLPQRVSVETMVDVFNDLAESKEPFYCVFEKQDGNEREMRARMMGPVKYSRSARHSYADVIDLDIYERGGVSGRKIVIQRVSEVSSRDYTFRAR